MNVKKDKKAKLESAHSFILRYSKITVWQGTGEPNCKNPPKIRLKKSWNWLMWSEIPTTIWPETEIVSILLKLDLKNLWNHFRWTYFWRISSIWDHCAERGRGSPNEFCPRPCPFFSFCIYILQMWKPKKQGICKTCLRVFWKKYKWLSTCDKANCSFSKI